MNNPLIIKDKQDDESELIFLLLSSSPLTSKGQIKEKLNAIFTGSFNLIGIYGEYSPCLNAVSEYFNRNPPVIPEEAGLSLVIDKENNNAVLLYISGSENSFIKKPLDPLSPLCYYVNVLITLCETVIACISSNMIES